MLPRSIIQFRKAAGKCHVPTFSVLDSGGPGGKGTNEPLQLVRDAYANGAAHQVLPDGTMQPKYVYEVAEKGCVGNGKVHGGNLQYNGGGRSRMF